MRAPGLVVLSRTHWHRMAPASPASRCARASASGGVTPSASAFASSLRTRLSRALGGSECIRNLQVDPIELSIELYPRHTTFRRRHTGPLSRLRGSAPRPGTLHSALLWHPPLRR